jgi:ankyrin repeat protein
MEIRAKDEEVIRILTAATDGKIDLLEHIPDNALTNARCTSGCSAIHWAAGTNQVDVLKYLILQRGLFSVDLEASKKSGFRTPLHYSCRNGCIEASKWLVEKAGAQVNRKAKHGVQPFQLAVWQNQLSICKWLVETQGVDPCQVNDYQCGAVHWMGTCPAGRANLNHNYNTVEETDGRELLPLAMWLAEQSGVDFSSRQRVGHTPLHKAAWGGHLALIEYLRDEHNMWDDVRDNAGNYAADLADMAHTPRHDNIARYLREECSRARAASCSILGVGLTETETEIRQAYLKKARQVHPDSKTTCTTFNKDESSVVDFDALHKAYQHLTLEGGHGKQCNPAHSLNLMLQVSGVSEPKKNMDDDDMFFKARLIAVLLEYGDKGLDISNLKKKWKQVWPTTPFPSYESNNKSTKRSLMLSEWLVQSAGDVIELVADGNGAMRVFAKDCSQSKVAEAARRMDPKAF